VDKMDTDILREIGLTEGEIKVYLALLEIGETNAGPIKNKTKLQNSVIHLCLNNLIQKGLINYVEKGRRKFYTATNPKHLIAFIDEKKRRLKAILPSLLAKQKEDSKYSVHIYEGEKGLKSIHEDILNELNKNEEFYVLGAPKEAHDKFEPYFLDFHKRRIKKGIKLQIIYKKEAIDYGKKRKEMQFTKVRYLLDELSSPMWITVYNDKIILFTVGEVLLGIVIENSTISKNFKEYFYLIWKITKP
jgi:sugar-specific transcriptional regulator TrmB